MLCLRLVVLRYLYALLVRLLFRLFCYAWVCVFCLFCFGFVFVLVLWDLLGLFV